jgi:hypothetical protein
MSTPINQAIVAYSTPVGDKDHDYTFEVAVVDYPTVDEEGDDVIIKVEAAPINPSDLGRMMGGGLWVAALSRSVVTLLLHCCYTVVTLLLHCCYTVVTLLLH